MKYDGVLTELNLLTNKLDNVIDIMFESTKEVIDIGNVNYELNDVINKLETIIDSLIDSNQINMLETAKDNITYASVDIIDNADIFDKIKRLRNAENTIINVKAKLDLAGHF